MANQSIYPYGTGGQLPSSIGVINDLVTGGANKALSAEQGKVLRNMMRSLQQAELSEYVIQNYIIATSNNADKNKWVNMDGYACALIPVNAGDVVRITGHAETYRTYYVVLTTDAHTGATLASFATGYTEAIPITLGETIEITIPSDGEFLYVTIMTSADVAPSEVLMSKDKFLTEADVSEMRHTVEGEYHTQLLPSEVIYFISSDSNKWFSRYGSYKSVLIPVNPGGVFKITANDDYICPYAVLASDSHTANTVPDYATGFTALRNVAVGETEFVTIPQDGAYLYLLTYTTHSLVPKSLLKVTSLGLEDKVDEKVKELIEESESSKSSFPEYLVAGELTNVIYTMDDFILENEYDPNASPVVDNLRFSKDLGKTWVTKANEFGIITNVFLFADGTLMIGSKKDDGCRLYWTRDLDTYVFQEASIIDYDGNAYTPVAGETRFFTSPPPFEHVYIDGKEVYCFWDYIIPGNGGTSNARAWYATSDADGVHVRSAFAFNLSTINGEVIRARHIHHFLYNKYNGYYYIFTGDHMSGSKSECYILKGKPDANHVWTWEVVANGQEYKLIVPAFDEGNLYAVTDYTDNSLANEKGVFMCPVDDIRKARFRYLFKATAAFMAEGSINSAVGLAWYLADNHGWRIIKTDYLGNSKILLAHNDHNFVWVDNSTGKRFTYLIGPNNNGDVYARFNNVGHSVSGEAWLLWNHQQTYNLTEMMRKAGATDFFKDWHTLLY